MLTILAQNESHMRWRRRIVVVKKDSIQPGDLGIQSPVLQKRTKEKVSIDTHYYLTILISYRQNTPYTGGTTDKASSFSMESSESI
jgi:hypothetical protein